MGYLKTNLVVFAVAAYLLTRAPLVAQSRNELIRRFGLPVAEIYTARPGVSVTATLGRTGQITEFVISPNMPDLIKSRNATLSTTTVKAVIDELIPRSIRGKNLPSGFINMACLRENDCNGTSENYERVAIYYNTAAEGEIHYAVVQLKGDTQSYSLGRK